MKIVRLIIPIHRYIGIPMSLVFVAWFLSGIVMIYTRGMPELTPEDVRRFQAPISMAAVTIDPDEAASSVDLYPQSIVLRSLFNRPAYVFRDDLGRTDIVFADSGERFDGAGWESAAWIVSDAFGASVEQVEYRETLYEADQWTLTEQRHLPLHRFEVDNADRTTVYVAANTAEIVLALGLSDKILAWIGAIPHWFYFTSLRIDQPLWYRTVVWTAAVGCLIAILGIVLVFTQFRPSSPFRFSESIRYRGWLRWHYYSGAIFGVFVLTWTFSGLLSMDPFPLLNRDGISIDPGTLSGGPPNPAQYRIAGNPELRSAIGDDAREARFVRIHGEPYIIVSGTADPAPAIVDATTQAIRENDFSTQDIVTRLQNSVDADIASATLIYAYDDYYYDRSGVLPLPTLRVEFADPASSWIYIDPRSSDIVRRSNRHTRLKRWLFNGLHSLDFGFWYDKRPLWDIVVVVLSLGGLASGLIGFWLGLNRIGRWAFRAIGRQDGGVT